MDSLATAATSVVTFVAAGDCPIMGLGSFGTLAFWGQKRVRMDGAAHSKVHQPVNELSQSSLEGKGLVGVNRHLDGVRRVAGPGPGHGPAPPGVAPPARQVMSILFSCQRSEAR
jgi:hypothetical protein